MQTVPSDKAAERNEELQSDDEYVAAFNHSHARLQPDAYGVAMVQGVKRLDIQAASRNHADNDVEILTLQIQTLRNAFKREWLGFDLSKEITVKVYAIRTTKEPLTSKVV